MPSSFRMLAAVVGVLLVLFGAAREARGDEVDADEAVVLVYRAAAGCPREGAFLGEVTQRTTKMRSPRPGETFRRFSVEITKTRGRLVIRDVDGTETVRVVTGEPCDEVVSAVALAVAIAIDPTVSLAPLGAEAFRSSPPRSVPRTLIVAQPQEADAPVRARPAKTRRRPFTAALAVEGLVATGVGPSALWGGGIAAMWTAPLSWEPSLRFQVGYVAGAAVSVGDAGEARFSRWAAGLEACPWRWRIGAFSLFPCAKLGVGALRAEGDGVPRATSDVRAWVAVGPSARARWVVGGLFVETGVAAMVPLTRDRFFFQPDVTISRAAPLGAELGLSVGAEL